MLSAFAAVGERERNSGQRVVEGNPPNPSQTFRRGPCAYLSPADAFPMRPLILPLIARSKFYDWAATPLQKFDVPSTITTASFIVHDGRHCPCCCLLLPLRRFRAALHFVPLATHHPLSLISSVSSPRSNDRMCVLPALRRP
jgi:hypothetical protein